MRLLIPDDISSARDGAFHRSSLVHSFEGPTMGTSWTAKIAHDSSLDRPFVEITIQRILDSIIQSMSPWEPDSDLRRFADADANSWVSFREDSFFVLQKALSVSRETNGAYDPTLAHLIDLLGFGPSQHIGYNYQSDPVSAALSRASYQSLKLRPETRTVWQPGGLGLDLCSIAKGYAVDRVSEELEVNGFRNFYFEIGGEARGLGCKPTGEPWVFSLERLRSKDTTSQFSELAVALCGTSLATSGNFHQFRTVNGQTVGHLVSLNGISDSLLHSVSVFSDKCIDADAYASALFLLGEEDGLDFATKHELAAVFLTADHERLSPRAERMLD